MGVLHNFSPNSKSLAFKVSMSFSFISRLLMEEVIDSVLIHETVSQVLRVSSCLASYGINKVNVTYICKQANIEHT